MVASIAIISPDEVKQRLNEGVPYSIIDARPYSQYAAGHLPGAVWMGWETWCEAAPASAGQALARAGYWGVLKEIEADPLQESLQQLGLRNDRPAIVYADGPISKGREARIAWMLLYWGMSALLLLDGGWSGWLKQGGSSDSAMPAPEYGQFHLHVQERRRVRLRQLKHDYQNNSMPLLVDVRTRAEFEGHEHAYQPRLGRLPGAVHMPYTALFDGTGNFVTKSVYLERLPVEVKDADCCVACCEVGVRSCLFALLHEIYTEQVVPNFDGSVMEWALDHTLSMER